MTIRASTASEGANIENILNFEKQYTGARTIRLGRITAPHRTFWTGPTPSSATTPAARARLWWTENGKGEIITVKTCFNESDEANYVVGQIMMNYRRGGQLEGTRRALPNQRPVQRHGVCL